MNYCLIYHYWSVELRYQVIEIILRSILSRLWNNAIISNLKHVYGTYCNKLFILSIYLWSFHTQTNQLFFNLYVKNVRKRIPISNNSPFQTPICFRQPGVELLSPSKTFLHSPTGQVQLWWFMENITDRPWSDSYRKSNEFTAPKGFERPMVKWKEITSWPPQHCIVKFIFDFLPTTSLEKNAGALFYCP